MKGLVLIKNISHAVSFNSSDILSGFFITHDILFYAYHDICDVIVRELLFILGVMLIIFFL